MKKVINVLPLTSVIICANLLILFPAKADEKAIDNSIDFPINYELIEERETFTTLNKQDNPVTNTNNFPQEYSQGQIYLDKVTDVNQLQDVSPQH